MMCTVCGCGDAANANTHGRRQHDHGAGIGGAHVPDLGQARIIQIEQDILGQNDRHAAANRALFSRRGIFALNLVSAPGSGKTTLLARTAGALRDELPIAVIVGDQQTSNDADRLRATAVPAVQVNTGKGCHLDAHMVGHALEGLDTSAAGGGLLFIENVGNLVCPAAFDLGEASRVVILSVTEGEDKPLKYPDIFHACDIMLLNKIDLLPHLEFDVERCVSFARRVNPEMRVFQVSATTGAGLDAWFDWLRARGTPRRSAVAAE